MFNKVYENLKEFIKDNYKYICLLIVFYFIMTFPLPYYIISSGGISDIDSRVKVDKAYNSKGSFNISYVTELKGTVFTYFLSFIVPDWKRVEMRDYKYDEEESIEDISFRSDLDLESANSKAIEVAYNLADSYYKVIDTKTYITYADKKTKLKVGDEILSMDGNSYEKVDDYKNYIKSKDVGDTIVIKVKRDEKIKEIPVIVRLEKGDKIIGIILEQKRKYETDPSVYIKFKPSESGPSGGLITTLDIYNKLTKEDITKGRKIAGTGTIEEDHSIGEIGEVEYKLLGAEKEKADIFLVPAGDNYKDCLRLAKKRGLKIKIIGVKTIEEAIEKLN